MPILFLTIGLILYALSILKSNSLYNELGLISGLSILYFFGLGFIVIAFFTQWKFKSSTILLLYLIIIIIILWATPLFLEGTARKEWSYINYSFADYIVRNGHINAKALNMWYHNWPSFSIIISSIVILCKIDYMSSGFFNIFPFVLVFTYLPFIYLIMRVILKEEQHFIWPAMFLFILGLWTGQEYLSPQGLAYLMLLIFIFLLAKGNFEKKERRNYSIKILFIIILLYVSLVITHLLTSVMGFIISLYFSLRYMKRKILICLFAIIGIAWIIYGSVVFFEANLLKFINEALSFEFIDKNLLSRVRTGNSLHNYAALIKTIYSSLFWVLAFWGVILVYVKKELKWSKDKDIFYLLIYPFLLVPFFIYGGEFFIRLFLFSLLFALYFILKLFKAYKLYILLIIIIFLLPLRIIAQYGNEMFDYIPKDYLTANFFVVEHVEKGDIIGSYPIGKIYFAERYFTTHQSLLKWDMIFDKKNIDYVIIGKRDIAWQILMDGNYYIINKIKNKILNNSKAICIYESKNVTLYKFIK